MLLNCVVYEHGHKHADIAVRDIGQWLGRPGCFVWVALQDPTAEELAQMELEFGLHELAVEDALKGHQRPKVEEYGSMVFVVLHLLDPTAQPGTDEDLGELAVFAAPHFVLSVRTRSSHGFHEVRERALRARTRAAAARRRLCAVCADGRGGGPLFSGARRL